MINEPVYGQMYLNYGYVRSEQPKRPLTKIEKRVYSLLPKGHEQPILCIDLAKLVDLSTREIKRIIFNLRSLSMPIGSTSSDPAGYYIIETPKEYDEMLAKYDRSIQLQILKRDALQNSDIGRRLAIESEIGGQEND